MIDQLAIHKGVKNGFRVLKSWRHPRQTAFCEDNLKLRVAVEYAAEKDLAKRLTEWRHEDHVSRAKASAMFEINALTDVKAHRQPCFICKCPEAIKMRVTIGQFLAIRTLPCC